MRYLMIILWSWLLKEFIKGFMEYFWLISASIMRVDASFCIYLVKGCNWYDLKISGGGGLNDPD